MRKIQTQEDIDRSAARRRRGISILLLVIMLGSVAGYAFYTGERSGGESSSGISNVGGRWVIPVNGQSTSVSLSYSPDETKEIPVGIIDTLESYNGVPVYIDSGNDMVYAELYNAFLAFSGRVQRACYGNCTEDLPQKDCSVNLVVWRDVVNSSRVYQQDKCIFIEGDLRSADAFLYKLLR